MTILRVSHSNNYTVINNTICTDKRLSWKAKGIWLYAFSRPDDWSFHVNDLINQSIDGRDAVRSGLKELEEAGYLVRQQKRENGLFGDAEWTFHETPQPLLKEKVPQTENPSSGNQTTENHPLPSTEAKLSTEAKESIKPPPNPPPFGGGGRIKYFNGKGEEKEITESEIFQHFLKLKYATATVQAAIREVQNEKTPINNILKYLEAICLRLEKNPQSVHNIQSSSAPPKNTTPLSEAINLGDLLYGR